MDELDEEVDKEVDEEEGRELGPKSAGREPPVSQSTVAPGSWVRLNSR